MAAKQFGTHRLSGTVGDVTYSHTKKGFKARQRTPVSMSERMSAQNFQAWRDHTTEFGNVTKEARILRSAFTELNWNITNKSLLQQAVKQMNVIRKTDTISPRGQRLASNGDLSLLIGFDFTGNGSIDHALSGGFSSSFDRVTGVGSVTIGEMIPKQRLGAPPNATHFLLSLGLSSINFQTEEIVKKLATTAKLPLNEDPLAAIILSETVEANSTDPVFIALKLEYFTELNGHFYPIMSNTFMNCTVIDVDQG